MPKILLVDDEIDTRELLARSLGRRGFDVTTAADGEIALGLAGNGFDVVVTDILMPRLDGIGLLKELRTREHPPVCIVITSFADKERAVAALNLGASFLIEKPFTTEQLVTVITRLLAEQTAEVDLDVIFRRRLSHLNLQQREQTLVIYLLKGLSNRDIADVLGSTEQSIKNNFHQLYQRLGIGSRSELFHLIFPI